ncbi:MAG TPA: SusD/RagB family nutrient-binding outer membrane lipoprotein [Flavisolibacter sp.]|jgi:hypothetical protein|nr:SusD/RagB family nutrient-binding outer membrane lipoprotein [Flavisolibacter sp.]
MKKTRNIFLAGAASVMLFASCSKKLDEAYANPNAPTRVPVETILPGLIGNFLGNSAAAGSGYGLGGDGLIIGRYIQYWGDYTSGSANDQYDRMGGAIGASDAMGSIWAAHYFGMGQNLNRMVEWANEEQKWDFVGAGWAIRAWSMLEATNEYGDIILKEAFNTNLQTFKYDPQPEVYDSVRVIAFRALDYFSRTDGHMDPTVFGNADAYFLGGNISKWKKFIYGIIARSYGYMSNVTGYNADSVIKYADLAMTQNTDNAYLKFANTGISGTSNYFGPLRSNVGGLRQGSYIADLMSGANTAMFTGVFDPRAPYMLRENAADTYRGIIPWRGATISTSTNPPSITTPAQSTNGPLAINEHPDNFWGNTYTLTTAPSSDKGRYLFRNGVDFPIMTASEMQFLKAEAAYRKGDKATALTAYTNAISMNIDMLTSVYSFNVPAGKQITAGAKATYLASPAIVPSAAGLTMSHIMLQKYIALFGWGPQETWVDMRRFHYTDSEGGKQVYANFTPPTATELYVNNNQKLVYRARPRYNSEYLYNIPELDRIGALALDYHTLPTWFAK